MAGACCSFKQLAYSRHGIQIFQPRSLSNRKVLGASARLLFQRMRTFQTPSEGVAKVVVITGVTKGLGRALALELASRGHTIVGCGRNEERLAALHKQLDGESKHLFKIVDVASDSNVEDFVKAVIEMKGVPDIMINNAGIINENGKLWEVPAAEFNAVIDINIKGSANMMRHFLPHFVSKKQGILVNVTSGWGRQAAAEVAPYCASKWAIEGLTKSVSKEVPQGVAVVALNPGVVNTDMLASCFGASASLYPNPDSWAPRAADAILGLSVGDNGSSLNV